MQEYEQIAIEFIDAFGINDKHLVDEIATKASSYKGDSETLGRSDVDWSDGYLLSPDRVAIFRFAKGDGQLPSTLTNTITAEPARAVKCDLTNFQPVYCYANKQGETSVVTGALVERATQIFGYDPDELTNVRVNPDWGTSIVRYCHPENSTYIAITPLLDDLVKDLGLETENVFND
jgi:hypothetical protein